MNLDHIVAFDLETSTGPEHGAYQQIVEVATVEWHAGVIVSQSSSLVSISERLSRITSDLTGLTDRDLQHAPPWRALARGVAARLRARPEDEPAVLLAYNGRAFDARVILAEFARAGVPVRDALPVLDPLIMVRTVDAEHTGRGAHSLRAACERRGLALPGHRALSDAHAALALYLALRPEYARRGLTTWPAVADWQARPADERRETDDDDPPAQGSLWEASA